VKRKVNKVGASELERSVAHPITHDATDDVVDRAIVLDVLTLDLLHCWHPDRLHYHCLAR